MADIEGVWAIVTSGVKQYIGCLPHCTNIKLFLSELNQANGAFVELNPVFDYVVHVQLSPQGATKIPVITPFDMLNGSCATYVQITGITFFADMQKYDRERYEKMVSQVMDEMARARLKQESGIELISSMPARRG